MSVTTEAEEDNVCPCCAWRAKKTQKLTNGVSEEKSESKAKANGETKPSKEAGKSQEDGSKTEDAHSGDKADGEKKSGDKADEENKSDDEDAADAPMQCQIKQLDRRFNDDDVPVFTERKTDGSNKDDKKRNWWRLFAFCIARHYDYDAEILTSTKLYVNPQPLRQLLKDVIDDPTDPIDVDNLQISSPYYALFYHREEIETKGEERFKDDADSLAQLRLLTGWIKSHFELDILAHRRCLVDGHRSIEYERLWTLFPPFTIAHTRSFDSDRAFKVQWVWYDEDTSNKDEHKFSLAVNYVDFDGSHIGTRKMILSIARYPGMRPLNELCAIPLDLHEQGPALKKALVERGHKFERYCGQHFAQYEGVGTKRINDECRRFNATGRVMVDARTHHRLDADDAFSVQEFPRVIQRQVNALSADEEPTDFPDNASLEPLTDVEAMITTTTVQGYSFTQKMFLSMSIDGIKPIVWNETCFDDLVLDGGVKKTVRALVSTHSKKRNCSEDIVKGKGQGLVCVLHGPPGVGKTLTAECVAEYVKRPLFMVSSGDLGTSSSTLDTALTRIMDMTETWHAVLLIDEADIFLERRSLHDVHRNAMVSVFLRVLEYYGGILFLTTNRVNTFDEAFKSRIHIPIRYTNLSYESRISIWKAFCARIPGGVDIDEKGYRLLAEHDLNGRQIKNVIKAAESLAAYDDVKLDLEQMQQVTKIQAMFEKDLSDFNGADYTAPGETHKDADRRNMFV